MTTPSADILYFINPYANDGNANRYWERAKKIYDLLPEKAVDITKITGLEKYIKDRRPNIIVIAGGDGTINTICNPVSKMKEKPIMTILPFGFGNALAHCLGVE